MSRVFGNITQSGYVVRDIDAHLRFLSDKAGIGPWFVARNVVLPVCLYRGREIRMEMHAALANSGTHQLELIQQVSPEPSIYTEWLERFGGRSPLQHVSSWEEDFDGAVARSKAKGWVMIQEGRSAYGPFAYLEHAGDPDVVIEITRKGPERRSIFEQIAAAAAGWDGTDPIREGWPKAQV
ncbi:VOC family protein [Pararhodobacter sp.]|uniref:VOC family protein n=1 Tax=Pararhodobacter sp. TaxID=2127056 RepID=UPI002FDFA137